MARTFESFEELKVVLLALGTEDMLMAVLLTPKLAQSILDADPVNRKLRRYNLKQLVQAIKSGRWDLHKSPPMRFLLPGLVMGDGQHRCRAVIETQTPILVSMCVVSDTLGVDEGASRRLEDHLTISYKLSDTEAGLAATITKKLCHVKGAGNPEFLETFREHQPFILESVRKPMGWLDEHDSPLLRAIFRPEILVQMRALSIREKDEPAESVDQVLYDAINEGKTAPEGSQRRALAKQLFDAMERAHSTKRDRKGPKLSDMLKWLSSALKCERDGILRNILTFKLPGDKNARGKRKPTDGTQEAA